MLVQRVPGAWLFHLFRAGPAGSPGRWPGPARSKRGARSSPTSTTPGPVTARCALGPCPARPLIRGALIPSAPPRSARSWRPWARRPAGRQPHRGSAVPRRAAAGCPFLPRVCRLADGGSAWRLGLAVGRYTARPTGALGPTGAAAIKLAPGQSSLSAGPLAHHDAVAGSRTWRSRSTGEVT